MKATGVLLLGLGLLLLPGTLQGSDHADPINLEVLESGLTDLFAFRDGEQMVVILATRRNLTAPPPYQLEPFEFAIYMDLHTPVTLDDAEERARYGGSIARPEGIAPDVTIKIRLKNDATLGERSFQGLQNPEAIRLFTGVRDDPFIFPRFFKRNAIAMVLSIPFASFPPGQRDWLLWATSTRLRDGVQIDHVGRSNRTQLGRFDFLNTLPPGQHVAAIRAHDRTRARIQAFLAECFPPLVNAFQPLFAIRRYDEFPDVMIYTTQYPEGYPNGRKLDDDVALLTCQQGDCPLIEGAFIDGTSWPRAAVNDRPFLKEFPYLAEPWPPTAPAPPPAGVGLSGTLGVLRDVTVFFAAAVTRICTPVMLILVAAVILVVLVVAIPVWLLLRWRYRRMAA